MNQILKKFDLDDQAVKIVEILIQHYQSTGSKFLYLQESLPVIFTGFSVDDLRSIFKKLAMNNIAYFLYDHNVRDFKLGLKKTFIKEVCPDEEDEK